MKKRKYIIIIICTFVVLSVFVPAVPQLSVTNADSGVVVLSKAVKPGDSFSVAYTHSVNKSEVEDYFVITEDYKIMVESTYFVAYGAGIPEPEEGQTLTITEDAVVIEGIDRLVDPYRLFVGVVADHRLFLGPGGPIRLTNLVPPQTTLIFQVERHSLWRLLTTAPLFYNLYYHKEKLHV